MSQRTYRARVTSKGQLTVPKDVRAALGVQAGDELLFEVGPQGVVVRPARSQSLFGAVEGGWRQGQGASPEESDAWLRQLRGHEQP